MSATRHARGAQRTAQLAIALALALAGCGGEDDTTTATPDVTTTTGATTTSPAPASDSELRDEFDRLVTRALVTAEGLDPAVARCAVNALDATVSDAELRRAASGLSGGGEVPGDLVDAAFEAGRECSGR